MSSTEFIAELSSPCDKSKSICGRENQPQSEDRLQSGLSYEERVR